MSHGPGPPDEHTGGDGIDQREETRLEWATRVVISTLAIAGYVFVMGVALAAAGRLVADHTVALRGTSSVPVWSLGLLATPAAVFLFVALYADADLRRPAWPAGHPPPADAWLLAVVAFVAVTVALWTPGWPELLRNVAVATAWFVAYALAPVWLARRCLARPSWELGTLAVLVTALVLFGISGANAALPPTTWPTEVAVAAPGLVAPYWLAARSPGSTTLGRRAAGALRIRLRR